MNEAGVVLDELMRERGIDGIPELVRRMKQFPELRTRHASVARVTTFMEEESFEGMPGFHPNFFRALRTALGLSRDEYERLLLAHFMEGEPPPESITKR